MNLFFHLASALAAVGLAYWALRLRRQRELLRLALDAAGRARRQAGAGPKGAGRRVVVAEPRAYLGAFAAALGVPFEREEGGPALPPARIEAGVVVEIFLSRGLSLIRWMPPQSAPSSAGAAPLATVELHVLAAAAAPSGQLPVDSAALAEALGGRVEVLLIETLTPLPATV